MRHWARVDAFRAQNPFIGFRPFETQLYAGDPLDKGVLR
jgi:hypothetical protein